MIQAHKNSELVLKVKRERLIEEKINAYEPFLDALFDQKYYFLKEASYEILRFLLNENYSSIQDLALENFEFNTVLQEKFGSATKYVNALQLKDKKACSVDLATGTGKSFLMYAIAQIALDVGIVDQVLVLCPSTTIEDGLMEKFNRFVGDSNLRENLPGSRNSIPRVISANQTILENDICIENIHAVYANTNSSISDSLQSRGDRTLILNDEAHHVFNKVTGSDKQNIKEWKKFIQNEKFCFHYIVNFTGTPYVSNDYFLDVVYQYSLSKAIEEKIVKSPSWLVSSTVKNAQTSYQIMYQNHQENITKYPEVKPISVIVTSDIEKAFEVYQKLVKFLSKELKIGTDAVSKKVIWVASNKPDGASEKERIRNLQLLKSVDDPKNSVEWIVSVSMLTEGWDVKNVFQIIPHESRAFNSKLLIAQVLGRGLRVPSVYSERDDLQLRVFNHEKFSNEIKKLFDEVLDIDDRLTIGQDNGSTYQFVIDNLSYKPIEKYVYHRKKPDKFDDNFQLKPQEKRINVDFSYRDIRGNGEESTGSLDSDYVSLTEGVASIYSHLKGLDIEKKTRFAEKYPIPELLRMLRKNEFIGDSDFISRDNLNRVKNAFYKLWDFGGQTKTYEKSAEALFKVNTQDCGSRPVHASSFRRAGVNKFFYQESFVKSLLEEEKVLFAEILDNRDDFKIEHFDLIKSPMNAVMANHNNEVKFLNKLLTTSTAKNYDSFFKNADKGFYSFPYAYKKATHMVYRNFNPDFFIKKLNQIIVVEIKDDKEESIETKAKLSSAEEHFSLLNSYQSEIEYMFVLLSPIDYESFFISLSKPKYQKFQTEIESTLKASP